MGLEPDHLSLNPHSASNHLSDLKEAFQCLGASIPYFLKWQDDTAYLIGLL